MVSSGVGSCKGRNSSRGKERVCLNLVDTDRKLVSQAVSLRVNSLGCTRIADVRHIGIIARKLHGGDVFLPPVREDRGSYNGFDGEVLRRYCHGCGGHYKEASKAIATKPGHEQHTTEVHAPSEHISAVG